MEKRVSQTECGWCECAQGHLFQRGPDRTPGTLHVLRPSEPAGGNRGGWSQHCSQWQELEVARGGPPRRGSDRKSVAHTRALEVTNQIYKHQESSKIVCTEEKMFFFPEAQYHFRKLNTHRACFSRTLKCLNKLLEGGLPGMILSGVRVEICDGCE